mgnify:CR=1 FL=1
MIINLPVTVEMSMPHVYANQIDCDKHLKYRDSVIISTIPQRPGTGVAAARLALPGSCSTRPCWPGIRSTPSRW